MSLAAEQHEPLLDDLESQQGGLQIQDEKERPSPVIRSMSDFFDMTRSTSFLTMIATEAKGQPKNLPQTVGVSLHACLLVNAAGTVKQIIVTSSPRLANKYARAFNIYDAIQAGCALYTFTFVTTARNATLIHRYQTGEATYMVDNEEFWVDYNLPLMVIGLARMVLDPNLNFFPRLTSPSGKLAGAFQFMTNFATLQGAVAAGAVIANKPIPTTTNLILTNVVSALVGMISLIAMRSNNPRLKALTTLFMKTLWSTAHSLTQIALIMEFANFLGPWGKGVQLTAWLLMSAAVTVGPILIERMQNQPLAAAREDDYYLLEDDSRYVPPTERSHAMMVEVLENEERKATAAELTPAAQNVILADRPADATAEASPISGSPTYSLTKNPAGFHHGDRRHHRAVSLDTGLAAQKFGSEATDSTPNSPQRWSKKQ